MQMVQDCPHCGEEARCRRRDFSEQTWSVLLAWGEIEHASVDQPICEVCYDDLREILIDRGDEVMHALGAPSQDIPKRTAKKANESTPAASKAKKTVGKAKKPSKVA